MMHPAAKHTVPLSRSEVNALSVLARNGDIRARDKLVLSHYRFLVKSAGNYIGRGVPIEDLISEGMIGLIRATETFSVARGCTFGSYAIWWIRHAISTLLYEQSLAVRVPANFFVAGNGPNQNTNKNRTMGATEKKEKNANRIERNKKVIDAIKGSPRIGHESGIENTIASNEPPPDRDIENFLNKKRVENLLSVLPKRDQDILRRKFGIGVAVEPLQSIGDSMGLSKEYIRVRRDLAIKELRYRFKEGIQ